MFKQVLYSRNDASHPILLYTKLTDTRLTLHVFKQVMDASFRENKEFVANLPTYLEEELHRSVSQNNEGIHIPPGTFEGVDIDLQYAGFNYFDTLEPRTLKESSDKQLWLFRLERGTYRPLTPLESQGYTHSLRMGRDRFRELDQKSQVIQIRMPWGSSTLDEAHIRVYGSGKFPILGSIRKDNSTQLDTNYYNGLKENTLCNGWAYPRILDLYKVSNNTLGIKIGLIDNLGDKVAHSGAKVLVQSTGGYLPLNTIESDSNGDVDARIVMLHLLEYETIKVKVGFEWYSGSDECYVRMVSDNVQVKYAGQEWKTVQSRV